MKNLISLTLVSLMIFGCKNQESTQIIDLERNDEVSITELIDSVSIVKLESNPECMMNFITKIIPYKNRFYIFDRRLLSVFCFDNQGHYLFKINRFGRGPEEYVSCSSICIDKYNDQLMLLVPQGYILYFDLDGNFISKIRLPEEIIVYNEVYTISSDLLLFISSNKYRASYYSREKKIILKRFLLRTEEYSSALSPIEKTYLYKDSIFFNDNVNSNLIINLSDTTNPVRFSWNFGENNNSKEDLIKYFSFRKEQQKQNKLVNLEEVLKTKEFIKHYPLYNFESRRYRGTSVRYNGATKYILYDKISKEYKVFEKTIEDIHPNMFYAHEDLLICTHYDKGIDQLLTENQKKLIEYHNPEKDNPFLVIYHIK